MHGSKLKSMSLSDILELAKGIEDDTMEGEDDEEKAYSIIYNAHGANLLTDGHRSVPLPCGLDWKMFKSESKQAYYCWAKNEEGKPMTLWADDLLDASDDESETLFAV